MTTPRTTTRRTIGTSGRGAGSIPRTSSKPYTVADDDTASLADWIACYGYSMLRQPELWLKGYTPGQIAAAIEELRQQHRPTLIRRAG